jgi:hypothetical protein
MKQLFLLLLLLPVLAFGQMHYRDSVTLHRYNDSIRKYKCIVKYSTYPPDRAYDIASMEMNIWADSARRIYLRLHPSEKTREKDFSVKYFERSKPFTPTDRIKFRQEFKRQYGL